MSDFEQWFAKECPTFKENAFTGAFKAQIRKAWDSAIASMQGEAKPVGMALQYGNDKTAAVFDAEIVPIGTQLFTYPPSAASKISEQDARIKELEQQLEVARKNIVDLDVSYGEDFESWLNSISAKDLFMTGPAEINLAKAVYIDAEKNLIKKLKEQRLKAAIRQIGGAE